MGLKMRLIACVVLAIFITTQMSACGGDNAQAQATPSSTMVTKDLTGFVNTYWYVPTAYLLSYQYNFNTSPKAQPRNDQTVWHITSVDNGFLLGCAFRSTNNGTNWQITTIVGSVTANNAVLLGFYGTTEINTSPGLLTSSSGQPAFLMQVSTGDSITGGLTHWAYMLPATSTDPAWTNLPGTNNQSIPAVTAPGC